MTDGETVTDHRVTSIDVTTIDVDADTVGGVAGPAAVLFVRTSGAHLER